MNKLVSVVLPVFNVQEYIVRCVDSILSQTYQELELIIVDDGSQDLSITLIQDTVSQDTRVKIITQENRGLGSARNTGINCATGDFLLFVDSDDFLDSQMIEKLVVRSWQNNSDLVVCGHNFFHSNVFVPLIISQSPEPDYLKLCLNDGRNTVAKLRTTAWGALFRADIIYDNNIRFKTPHFEDTPFFIEFVSRIQTISIVPEALYQYVIRTDSITQSRPSAAKLNSFYTADRNIRSYLFDYGLLPRYESEFRRFHLIRIFLYGGFKTYYLDFKCITRPEFKDMLVGLKKESTFLWTCRVWKCSKEEFVLSRVLLLGIFLNKINEKLAHMFFVILADVCNKQLERI